MAFQEGSHELGYFGNIWVKQNFLPNAGDFVPGHYHDFDHVSLLVSGKVSVEIDGYEPKEFTAPTFIVVRKNHRHTFRALEDKTVWYCVFAAQNIEGDMLDRVGEIFEGKHDPLKTGEQGENPELLGPLAKATIRE